MSLIAVGLISGSAAVTAVGVVGSAALGAYSSYQSGKAQEAMADYNAEIAQNEAIAQKQAIEAEARRMSKGHREAKARGRVSVSGRGGLAEGTDLLALAEQSRNMQLDQLELQRQQDIAKTHGASQVAMYKYQGEQARSPYRWISAGLGGLAGGAGAIASASSSRPASGSQSKSSGGRANPSTSTLQSRMKGGM
jgi:hypothetical protein